MQTQTKKAQGIAKIATKRRAQSVHKKLRARKNKNRTRHSARRRVFSRTKIFKSFYRTPAPTKVKSPCYFKRKEINLEF